jgi:hypothetical protein
MDNSRLRDFAGITEEGCMTNFSKAPRALEPVRGFWDWLGGGWGGAGGQA